MKWFVVSVVAAVAAVVSPFGGSPQPAAAAGPVAYVEVSQYAQRTFDVAWAEGWFDSQTQWNLIRAKCRPNYYCIKIHGGDLAPGYVGMTYPYKSPSLTTTIVLDGGAAS